MPGALMQLVAYGAQDVYLTGNPQMTYWKVVYRRCTNFAMESIEQVFNGQGDFGSYVQCVVGRNGDLIHNTFLVVTLPEIDCCWSMPPCITLGEPDPDGSTHANAAAARIAWILGPRGKDANWARWIDYPGENLIDYVEVDIGGTIIDRQYGEWMHIWNQLTLTNEKREGYHKMIGHTTELTYLTMGRAPANSKCVCCKQQCEGCAGPCNTCAFRCNLPETTLYIPLLFWFCRNPGLALPLIALQYHEVKINVQLRDLNCLLWAVDSLSDGGDPLAVGDPALSPILLPKACGTSMQAVAGATMTIPDSVSLWHPVTVPGIASRNHGDGAYTKHLVTCSLFIDYIFLDTDERRYMAQNPHEYLIEQVQFSDNVSTSVSENSLELEFNHPCKEIFLTTQQEYFRDCCKQFEACEPLYKALGIQPFNYTDCLDAMPPAYHAFHGPDLGTDDSLNIASLRPECLLDVSNSHFGTHIIHKGLFRNPGAAAVITAGDPWGDDGEAVAWSVEGYANGWMDEGLVRRGFRDVRDPSGSFAPLSSVQNSGISDAGAIVLAKTALNMHCWGKNPVYSLVLQLNGQDRFSERSGRWFDEIQPFKYHTHQPDAGINLYSFALHPEKHNPSGTLNFSRIDNAILRFTLTSFMFNTNNNAVNLKVYATNYNVLRIMSGMGGLAYSN
jgi:hypothetical protein